MKYRYYIVLAILLIGCNRRSPNFLLDEFPHLISNAWDNTALLKEFKGTQIESAITEFPKYNDAFYEALESVIADSELFDKAKESFRANELDTTDTANNLLIFAILHKYLNGEIIELQTLKKYTDSIYLKHQIINQDNSIIDTENASCYIEDLSTINKWLTDSMLKINYIDADFVLKSSMTSCASDVEFMELYNETLLKYLEVKPIDIIVLLEEGNYNTKVIDVIDQNLRNPVSDRIDLADVLNSINLVEESKTRNRIKASIESAIRK